MKYSQITYTIDGVDNVNVQILNLDDTVTTFPAVVGMRLYDEFLPTIGLTNEEFIALPDGEWYPFPEPEQS